MRYAFLPANLTIILHNNNTVANLTVEQVSAIFKGEITNWSKVGNKDGVELSKTAQEFSVTGIHKDCQ